MPALRNREDDDAEENGRQGKVSFWLTRLAAVGNLVAGGAALPLGLAVEEAARAGVAAEACNNEETG